MIVTQTVQVIDHAGTTTDLPRVTILGRLAGAIHAKVHLMIDTTVTEDVIGQTTTAEEMAAAAIAESLSPSKRVVYL